MPEPISLIDHGKRNEEMGSTELNRTLDDLALVTANWLAERLKASQDNYVSPSVLVLDCRASADFERARVRSAVHINVSTLPSILFKRFVKGTLSICSIISAKDVRDYFSNFYRSVPLVLVDSEQSTPAKLGSDSNSLPDCRSGSPNFSCVREQCAINKNGAESLSGQSDCISFITVLAKKLKSDGCDVSILKGGFRSFYLEHPELCVLQSQPSLQVLQTSIYRKERQHSPLPCPLLELDKLKLADSQSSLSSCSLSDLASPTAVVPDDDLDTDSKYGKMNARFPIEIIPRLFLGNAKNSSDFETLERYGIKYILNVTPNLPNVFEEKENFRYLQIPISDHWSQDLAAHFPQAIAFIDEGRAQNYGVLVHCLAGISRSVTITVAYLMHSLTMSMEHAYDLVKQQKPNISPNFNFMGQLLDFEVTLFGARCGTSESSPDSGRSSSCSSCLGNVVDPAAEAHKLVAACQDSQDDEDGALSPLSPAIPCLSPPPLGHRRTVTSSS